MLRVAIFIATIYSFKYILRPDVFADTSKPDNLPNSLKLADAADRQAKKVKFGDKKIKFGVAL